MLQQTQVATVIPYFEHWLRDFPDLESLAAASQDEVLAHWSGLGYYARARNLHKAAMECMSEHNGALPATPGELVSLPGIGESTANAIISQTTDQPFAILDGNVKRTLSRHALVEGWYGKAAIQKQLWAEAEKRLPATRGADYTQAIMDLGALICVRKNPACDQCPVSKDCEALRLDKTDQIPVPKPKRKIREIDVCMLILKDEGGRVLLEKRPPAGIWGGLWTFPSGEHLDAVREKLGLSLAKLDTLAPEIHRLTHLLMHIQPYLARKVVPEQVKCSARQQWIKPSEARKLGMPKPVTDLLQQMESGGMK